MYRYLPLILILAIFLCTGCTGEEAAGEDSDTETAATSQESSSSGATSPAASGPSGPSTVNISSGEELSMQAQDLMRDGDIEGAIRLLEDMKANEIEVEDLDAMLIDAHLLYAAEVSQTRRIDPMLIYEVMFNHYQRVLELDPENEEAHAGIASIGEFLPVSRPNTEAGVDPLMFLPDDTSGETEAVEEPAEEAASEENPNNK